MTDKERGSGKEDQVKEVSPWEWVAAGISLVIVLGAMGFLAVQAVRGNDSPPRIAVEVDSILPGEEGFLVEFTVRNSGETTVAGLHVAGELGDPGTPLETSETVIDFVPAGGERRAGLFFTRDPRENPLRLRPLGYDLP